MSSVLVLGATGFVGSRLVEQLSAAGHRVRACARSVHRQTAARRDDAVGWHAVDVRDRDQVAAVMAGVDVVYHLVHSLADPDFARMDRQAADAVAAAAVASGVRQIVYVGGPRPPDPTVSSHLSSRAEVGEVFAACRVPALILQPSMVIGADSTSFTLLRSAAESTPLVPQPRWMSNRSMPIAEADLLHYLVAAADLAPPVDAVLDVAGPETLSYLELVNRVARVLGYPVRIAVPVPLWSHRLAAWAAATLTGVDTTATRALFESLEHELLPTTATVEAVLPLPAHGVTPVDRAIRAACGIEAPQASVTEGFTDENLVYSPDSAEILWQRILSIGGEHGWYTLPLVWAMRGAADHLLGGVGAYRGRPAELSVGDVVDFWTVLERDDAARRLVLRADMRMPGTTDLEMTALPAGSDSRYRQRIRFVPDGQAGELYWWLQKPAHDLVFATMAHNLADPSTGKFGAGWRAARGY